MKEKQMHVFLIFFSFSYNFIDESLSLICYFKVLFLFSRVNQRNNPSQCCLSYISISIFFLFRYVNDVRRSTESIPSNNGRTLFYFRFTRQYSNHYRLYKSTVSTHN